MPTASTDLSYDDEVGLLDLARSVAGSYVKKHPGALRYMDDLIGDACLGVADALAKHDAEKGASVKTYAYRRASGALIDGIRDRAPLTRGAYSRGGAEAAEAATPVSLDWLLEEAGVEPSLPRSSDSVADVDEAVRLLHLCTHTEQLVITAVVMYGFPGRTVAAWLGVTESAVSQFKSRGLARMREGSQSRRSSVPSADLSKEWAA